MKELVKKLTLEDNKKCRMCDNVAWYQISSSALCEFHMQGFIEFHEDLVKFREENK